jgi:hypothetical protein
MNVHPINKAIHIWRTTKQDSRTIVRTEEFLDGLLARILRGPMQRMLKIAIANGLGYLKAEIERKTNQLY